MRFKAISPPTIPPLAAIAALLVASCGDDSPTAPNPQTAAQIATSATEKPTAGKAQPADETIGREKVNPKPGATLTAEDLVTDPLLTSLVEDLTRSGDATRIRLALDDLSAALRTGDGAMARQRFRAVRKAFDDYVGVGGLNGHDGVSIGAIDLFLAAVEPMLPDKVAKLPARTGNKTRQLSGGRNDHDQEK